MERLKLSDFTYLCFKDDVINREDLERKGLKILFIEDFIKFDEKDFKMKFKAEDVSKVFYQKILAHPLLKEYDRLILGFNHFKTDSFLGFVTRQTVYKKYKDEWKYFSHRCDWEYALCIKVAESIFFIEDTIECRFRYPEHTGKDIFQLIVMPNTQRHFVFYEELNEEEKEKMNPKYEVFRRLENYFYNDFYNCPSISIEKWFE